MDTNQSRRRIVFATNNAHKLREIREILGDSIDIVSLGEIGCHEELPETAGTIPGNATQKAQYVSERYAVDCFADDTGLEVNALDGAPGVNTARFAADEGHDHDTEANIDKLLRLLEGVDDRSARFVTVISLARVGHEPELYEGECRGAIATERRGAHGFGYDSIYCPDDGDGLTFAQMGEDAKNAISHRSKAVKLLAERLKVLQN